MTFKHIDRYLASVGEQIRWKRARKPLLDELEAHIEDRRAELIHCGSQPEEAALQAVKEMGDPIDVGLSLDRIHRPRPNWSMMCCAAALLTFGMILMWVLGDRQTYFGRMALYATLGMAALTGGYFLDYTILAKLPMWPLFAICGVCAALPFFGNMFLSTAAQLCYALPVLFLPLVYRTRDGEKKSTIAMMLGFCTCQAAVIMSHTWISLYIYIMVVCGGMVIFAAANGWLGRRKIKVLLGAFVPPAAIFLFLCAISHDSLTRRLNGVINAQDDPMGMGWIPLRVRELISTSQFIGKGSSSELLDAFIAPNELCSVEHLLAVASHELGYIVLVVVLALVVCFGITTIIGIRRQSCIFGQLTLLCIGLCFGLRTFFYLIRNLGFTLIYFEGIPLFSYCGKLMIIDMLMVGLLLSVFRTGSIARDSSIKIKSTTAN